MNRGQPTGYVKGSNDIHNDVGSYLVITIVRNRRWLPGWRCACDSGFCSCALGESARERGLWATLTFIEIGRLEIK